LEEYAVMLSLRWTPALFGALIVATSVPSMTKPAIAGAFMSSMAYREIIADPGLIIEARAAVGRGGAAVGPRGGAVVRRSNAVAGPRRAAYRGRTAVVGPRGIVAVRKTTVVRPGFAGGGVRWARPASYRWPVGGAIAAGAAVGFVTAATAVAWAGAPPASGMCWYYTDTSRTQGFWDYCPR
jgi:hypothetical protein